MKKRFFAMMATFAIVCTLFAGCTSNTGNTGTTGTTTDPGTTSGEASTDGGTTDGGSTGVKGSELNIALASSPETLDPTMNSAVDGGCYAIHHFEGLMRYKWDGTGVEYGMASGYEVSDDGLVWTFTIRDNTNWSDGEPVTAHDFEYSWKRLADPETAAPYAYDMAGYVKKGIAILDGELPLDEFGVKAIDDKTFEVTLENPCPYFAEIAAFPVFMPLRKDKIEEYGEDWVKTKEAYVSNGPFFMESFSMDENMVSLPNPNYWDAENVLPSKITWLFLTDDKAQLVALRSGAADFIDGMPTEEVAALEADGLYGQIAQLGTYYISFNTEKAPMDNALFRKALTLAIDTKYIAEVIREGKVSAAEAFVGTGFRTAGHNQDFRDGWQSYVAPDEYEQNKEEAKQALADAGYPNGEGVPKIEYLLNDDSGHIAIAEALQNMWKEVLGVNVDIRVAEWATVTADRRAGNFSIARNGWIGDYNDPATMLALFTSYSGNNDGKYNSAEYDAKFDASNKEGDPAKRNQLLHEAEDILMGQDFACAPIYYYTDEYGVIKELKGWGITPLGFKFFAGASK